MIDSMGSMLAVAGSEMANLAAPIGCGIVIVGAGVGIGLIGGKAVDGIARQPEAGGRIFNTMIIAAALIEGITFFALLICFLTIFWAKQ